MSKILQNTTASPVVLTDVGVTVPASGNYTINPTDYLLFAASSNTITQVGSGVLTVNDGSATLSIANGTALIQGLFPSTVDTVISGIDSANLSNKLLNADACIFGRAVVAHRVSQVSIQFNLPLAFSNLTTTLTSTGTATQSNNQLVLATGTGTTSSAKVNSANSVYYLPGKEIYAQFTANFTTPTSAASEQRAGLYDANNGFFVGYHGTSFGVTIRNGASDTFTAAAAFNGDLLDGSASSQYTSNGSPVAINYTFKQVYRIRYGWLGIANAIFEVMSPDGAWVVFHTIRSVNTITGVSIASPSLPFTIEATKTSSDATNLQIFSASADAGIVGSSSDEVYGESSITAVNGTVTMITANRSTIAANISGTWVASLVVEGQNGDGSWYSVAVYNSSDVPLVSAITINQNLIISCSGFTQVRIRASAYTSGTVNVSWNSTAGLNTISAQIIPSDGTKYTYSACTTALAPASTATDIFTLTGSATKIIRIIRVGISATQTTAGTGSILFIRRSAANSGGTSAAPTIVQHDTTDPSASATVLQYTANPTSLGATVGNLRSIRLEIPAPAGTLQPQVEFDFGNGPSKAIVLRGTSQVFAINLNSTTFTGGSFNIYVEWTEE